MNTRTLTYTPDGQIKSIKDNDKLIATYQYNHLRQRIAKTTYDDKQNIKDTTQYLWDKGLLSAEIKDDKVIRRYVYLDIMPVAVLDYGYDDKNNLKTTQVYSIHTDHLGTPKAITNDKQEIVWQIDLDTFGETKDIQSKDNFQFNLRFAGQYFDHETGYHYNYHRYYDPKVGRYLTSDPIGLNGGSLNTYAYVDNEVWNAIDPYGLMRIYMFPNNGGGQGAVPTYEFHFDPLTKQAAQEFGIRGRVGKIVDGFTAVVGLNYPKPYEPKDVSWLWNYDRAYGCANFDSILLAEYNTLFPNKPSATSTKRLTLEEARRYLNTVRSKYKDDMNKYYPEATNDIIKIADEHGWKKYNQMKRIGLGVLTNPDDRYGDQF